MIRKELLTDYFSIRSDTHGVAKKIRCCKKIGMDRSFFTMYAMFPGVQDDRKKFQSILAVVQKFFCGD